MSKFEIIIVGNQFAFRLALIAFVVVTLRGLIAGDDFFGTIQVALFCLGLFFVFGYFLGDLARRLVEEHAETEATILLNDLIQASHDSV